MPKFLKIDIASERRKLEDATPFDHLSNQPKLIAVDRLGMMPICLTIVLGVFLGKITIPLPGGASFSLGTSGGPLVAGLLIGHINHIGALDLKVRKNVLECMREFGLVLFLIAAGTKGGAGFVKILTEYGPMLFVYGAIMTLVPMIVGYLFAKKVLKLSIFDNLGAICGGMTSTPALGTLIQVAGTDDVATSYASTYPIALVAIVIFEQLIVLFL
jgi:putative transport protein